MKKRPVFTADVGFYAGWTLVLIAALFVFVPQARALVVEGYENVAFAVNPSAARAYAYGERHFDASDPGEYNINRANYFFEKAAAIDPSYPYLYHELARVAFLEDNFPLALSRINFQISMHGDSEPNSYYVRGLIEGYMGDYTDAVTDYTHYLQFDPTNWAAMNDDAWVLLKADRFQEAADITARGLGLDPQNPWLLNSHATALYELGDDKAALASAQAAETAVQSLTDAQWSVAYPGNDPGIAGEGVATFKQAVADNVHTISLALASSTIQ